MADTLFEEAGVSEDVVCDFVKKHFGEQATAFDYKVAGAAVSLYCGLPPSHETSSIVKTMRGKAKAKVCLNRPEAGIIEGMKQYKVKQITDMVKDVSWFLKSGDVTEDEDLGPNEEGNYDAPEWIGTRIVDRGRGAKIAEVFNLCGEKFGKEAPKPEKTKVNKVKPDDVFGLVKKKRLFEKAYPKMHKLMVEFLESDKAEGWRVHNLYKWNHFRSKSVKDGVLTFTWNISNYNASYRRYHEWSDEMKAQADKEAIEKFKATEDAVTGLESDAGFGTNVNGKKYVNRHAYKAPVLVTKFSEDGTELLEWSVELKDVKSDY